MDVRWGVGISPGASRSARWGLVANFLSALLFAWAGWLAFPSPLAAQSICAEVKIQINQRVSFERQAFDAMLRIRNGLEGVQVESIDVNLTFKDLDGGQAASQFFSRLDTTTGISGSVEDASGVVAAASTGEAHWLIIPTAGAGGTSGKNYQIGATVTYRMTGDAADRTVEVIPEIITVRPQPLLALDYFLPGYVYADDPLTPETEPTVPFTLGVRISNVGYGAAQHTTIESAQPEIVQNNQGLLIDFLIVGSYVDDQPAQPSLMIDFGDIAPGQSRMGRWLMTTTLSGEFFKFEAEYTHADELGGELTSLLGPVTPHLLTHDVLVVRPGRDNVRDFLAQAIGASDTDTYRVYESDGAVSEVLQQFAPAFSGTALSFPAQSGSPLYARAQINFDGQERSISAVRTDTGQSVPAANIWFSKRRNAGGDSWIYFLNLFESDPSCNGGSCTYELNYDGTPTEASLAGNVYEDLDADGIQDAGEQGLSGVLVTLQGSDFSRDVTTGSGGAFQFADLPAGTYALTVGAVADHYDGVATIGSAGGSAIGDTISGIVLAAGAEAVGYSFAKPPILVQTTADLKIEDWAASTTSPRMDEAFTLTLRVSNAGPDVTDAEAGITLPPTLEVLSATPSVGTFNAATGRWTIGSLDPMTNDRIKLTLQVRATVEGAAVLSALVSPVDASVLDPNTINNLASLAVQVRRPPEVTVTPSFARESRMLVFFGCGADGVADSACLLRRNAFDTYLTNRSVEHLITQSAADFRDELRSGHWNGYWVHDDFGEIDSLADEIGMGVLRGDSLIVDGLRRSEFAALDSWIGISRDGSVRSQGEPEEIRFVPNDLLDFEGLTVVGGLGYQLTTGTLIAKYRGGAPAIVLGPQGQGRALLFAYDLAASLTENSAYVPWYEQIAAATLPPIPERYSADAYAPVNLQLENVGGPVEIDETLSLPNGAHLLTAIPTPTSASALSATWRKSLAVSATFDARVGLRTPSDIGLSSLVVDVAEVGASAEALAHAKLPLQVVLTGKRLSIVQNLVSSLIVPAGPDETNLNKALKSLNNADSARANGQLNDALGYLIGANSSLSQISIDTSEARTELAWLLQAFEREWYLALSACTAANAPPNLDLGLSFSPFYSNEGLRMREITPGGLDWRLGADTKTDGAYAAIVQNLTDDRTYQWFLSYDSVGNRTFSLRDGATLINSVAYNGEADKLLFKGNGLRLSIGALAGSNETSITVGTTSVENALFSDLISASATATAANASLYYYGNQFKDGFQASGTVKIRRPRSSATNQTPRLSFAIQVGYLGCKNLER